MLAINALCENMNLQNIKRTGGWIQGFLGPIVILITDFNCILLYPMQLYYKAKY